MKITNIYKTTAALIFLMVAVLWPAVDAWGQVKGDKYEEDYSSDTIQHKPAKWYNIRENIEMSQAAKDMDTFDDDEKMFSPEDNPFIANYPEQEIQAAHTYIDTIYMHPGTSVTLTLPDKLNDVSVRGSVRMGPIGPIILDQMRFGTC